MNSERTMARLATVKTATDAGRELESARVQATSADAMVARGHLTQRTADKAWKAYFVAQNIAKSFGVWS